jgi:hypothetical protein
MYTLLMTTSSETLTQPPEGSYDYYYRHTLESGLAEQRAQEDRDEAAIMARALDRNPYSPDVYVPFRNNYEELVAYHADKIARVAAALSHQHQENII